MTDEELREHYGRILEEYRFQVDFNWRRAQYFLALNVTVLGLGIGLLANQNDGPSGILAVLFAGGIALAILGLFVIRTQHGYYGEIRNLKNRLEERLEMGNLAIMTTPGMGSERKRLIKVTTAHQMVLALLAVGDLVGLVVSLCSSG